MHISTNFIQNNLYVGRMFNPPKFKKKIGVHHITNCPCEISSMRSQNPGIEIKLGIVFPTGKTNYSMYNFFL